MGPLPSPEAHRQLAPFVDQLSAEIDRDVRQVLRDALTVCDVDAPGLADAAPDVVLTQDLWS